MAAKSRSLVIGLTALVLALSALSCSKTETAKLQPPTFYSEDILNQAAQLIDEGYAALSAADLAGAVAKFTKVDSLIPNGLAGTYHIVCAYARTGDTEKAIAALTGMIDRGYDRPEELMDDTDFESLRTDARFGALVDRARQNYETNSAPFALGLPELTTLTDTMKTDEALAAWTDRQNRLIQMHGHFWTGAEYKSARIDFFAHRLAYLRELKKSDTAFDYQLERVRAAVRLGDPYAAGWGTTTDLVIKEANQLLRTSPAAEKAAEANYQAGFALSMKYRVEDTLRATAYNQAQGYFASVPDGTPYTGAAKGMTIVNRIHMPNANETELGAQLKAIIEQHPNDANLFRVVSTQFANEGARFLWPIPIDLPDIDGKTVALADYAGKAVMIDFWATWCPPCRAELPNLVAVYNEYHAQGLEVLSISLDRGQEVPMDAYRNWIDSAGMHWRHIYDGNFWNTELVRRYFVGSIPAPFLVGRDGSLVAMGDELRGGQLRGTVAAALGI